MSAKNKFITQFRSPKLIHFDLLETKESIEVDTKQVDVLFPKETLCIKIRFRSGEYNALEGAENLYGLEELVSSVDYSKRL